jgi:hypothetical protein
MNWNPISIFLENANKALWAKDITHCWKLFLSLKLFLNIWDGNFRILENVKKLFVLIWSYNRNKKNRNKIPTKLGRLGISDHLGRANDQPTSFSSSTVSDQRQTARI